MSKLFLLAGPVLMIISGATLYATTQEPSPATDPRSDKPALAATAEPVASEVEAPEAETKPKTAEAPPPQAPKTNTPENKKPENKKPENKRPEAKAPAQKAAKELRRRTSPADSRAARVGAKSFSNELGGVVLLRSTDDGPVHFAAVFRDEAGSIGSVQFSGEPTDLASRAERLPKSLRKVVLEWLR
ncbi:MAG: hypothetical protein RLY70_4500 [Planctomycetota bacterium]|jgi:outer membrane biosynthesis protein TonB